MLHSSCGDSSRRTHRTVTFQPDATVASGGNARGRSVKRLSHGGSGGGGGNGELTLEKLTFGAGLIFILVNVVLIYQYMPRHDTHKHSHSRFDRWWRQKLKRFSTEIPTSPLPPGGDQDAPSAMLRALTQCAAAPRCACRSMASFQVRRRSTPRSLLSRSLSSSRVPRRSSWPRGCTQVTTATCTCSAPTYRRRDRHPCRTTCSTHEGSG